MDITISLCSLETSRSATMTPKKLIHTVLIIAMAYSTAMSAKPPNIVLIMADDLGIGDIGCFGNDTIKTPHLDRLAAQGVRLNHDLATAAICTPSRSAFQTGRYPIRMGMAPHNMLRVHFFPSCTGGLPNNETTIGELAKTKDYATAFIGKWHLGMNCHTFGDYCHHPLDQGYDYFYGMPMSNSKGLGNDGLLLIPSQIPHINGILVAVAVAGIMFVYALKRFGIFGIYGFVFFSIMVCIPSILFFLMMQTGARLTGLVMRNFDVVEQPIVLEGFTDRLIAEGVNFLKERQTDEKPFLLVMSWIQVHTALHAIKPFKGRSAHGLYGDEVEEMDWSVGEILKALDTLGLASNTFVHFTSDHGGHQEEKGLHKDRQGGWNGIYKGGKAQGGMEGGIRVPSIIRWPGVIPAGSVVTVPTSHMDINPTVAAIIGAELPKDRQIDGQNILPVLKAGAHAVPPHKFLVHYCGHLIHAVRYTPSDGKDVYKAFYATHKYKPGTYECDFTCLCVDRGVNWHDPPILYNIAKDPSENNPLDINEKQNQAILKTITQLLDEHKRGVVDVESQFLLRHFFPRLWLQPCCNFPYCDCVESVPAVSRSSISGA